MFKVIFMNRNKIKGKIGEEKAKNYLLNKGYKILKTNYRNKIGEIDIIAEDGKYIVFVEVKTRTNTAFGYAFEAVNYPKQKRIMKVSLAFLKQEGINNRQVRYDIIEVYLQEETKINHIENAFCL